jgi:hypothetical protein
MTDLTKSDGTAPTAVNFVTEAVKLPAQQQNSSSPIGISFVAVETEQVDGASEQAA